MQPRIVKWGILGTGNIAKQIAIAFRGVENAELVAVGSRTRENAEAFGELFAIPRRHASYHALATDPEVDAIYVATPNALHFAHASACLEKGKAVLLEKPFTVNAREAEALVKLARERRLFLMEAMWTRFIPAVRQALAWIEDGSIGDVRFVEASFGFRSEAHELEPLLSKELATGSLLDVGVYCVSLACAAFGRVPSRVVALSELADGGVDRQAAFALGWSGGGLAIGASSVTHETRHDASISGAKGRIVLHAPFWCAPAATLIRRDVDTLVFESGDNSYAHELAAATACVREGRLEHAAMPLDESVAIMRVLDALRTQANVRFAADAGDGA